MPFASEFAKQIRQLNKLSVTCCWIFIASNSTSTHTYCVFFPTILKSNAGRHFHCARSFCAKNPKLSITSTGFSMKLYLWLVSLLTSDSIICPTRSHRPRRRIIRLGARITTTFERISINNFIAILIDFFRAICAFMRRGLGPQIRDRGHKLPDTR